MTRDPLVRERSFAIIAARDSAARRTRYKALVRAAEWLHGAPRDKDGNPSPTHLPRGRYQDFDGISRPELFRRLRQTPVVKPLAIGAPVRPVSPHAPLSLRTPTE